MVAHDELQHTLFLDSSSMKHLGNHCTLNLRRMISTCTVVRIVGRSLQVQFRHFRPSLSSRRRISITSLSYSHEGLHTMQLFRAAPKPLFTLKKKKKNQVKSSQVKSNQTIPYHTKSTCFNRNYTEQEHKAVGGVTCVLRQRQQTNPAPPFPPDSPTVLKHESLIGL